MLTNPSVTGEPLYIPARTALFINMDRWRKGGLVGGSFIEAARPERADILHV